MKLYAYGRVYCRGDVSTINTTFSLEEFETILKEVEENDGDSETLNEIDSDKWNVYYTLLSCFIEGDLTPSQRLERLKALKGDEGLGVVDEEMSIGIGLNAKSAKVAFVEVEEEENRF